jgi:hypothetical protein
MSSLGNEDRTPEMRPSGQSPFAPFAVPHSFHPNLGLQNAFVAVIGTLTRIFGSCILFSLWGGLCAWTWTAIPQRMWRIALVTALALMFPALLAGLLRGIGAVERRLRPAG